MTDALLKIQNVNFSYKAAKVLYDVNAVCGAGDYIALIGENGSGKSTLLQLLSGFMRPDAGHIYFFGKEIFAIAPQERAKNIAVIFQHENTNFPFTALEIVSMGLYPAYSRSFGTKPQHMNEIYAAMELTSTLEFANQFISELSGGEKQRVLLARAIVQKPKLLLLDEALAGLDVYARYTMSSLLKTLSQTQNMTIIGISHDLQLAAEYSSRVFVLKKGEAMKEVKPEIVNTKNFLNTYFFYKGGIKIPLGRSRQ